jgi:hypothetical protein
VIQLHNAGIGGALPPALISLLPQLKQLVVHDNVLTGPSPLTLLSGEAVHDGKNKANSCLTVFVFQEYSYIMSEAFLDDHTSLILLPYSCMCIFYTKLGDDGHVEGTGMDKLAKAMAVAKSGNKLKHKLAAQRAKLQGATSGGGGDSGLPGAGDEEDVRKVSTRRAIRSFIRLLCTGS